MSESNEGFILGCKKPWDRNENTIWLASTLKLVRNIEKFPFAGKLSVEQRKQIRSLVGKELTALPILSHPVLIPAEETTPLEKEYLLEHFLVTQSFQQAYHGEAFVLDDTGLFFAIVNVDDHIQLQLTDCSGEIEKAWTRLVEIETALGGFVKYAYSNRFGFLTADPGLCGTALVVYAFLHVPALCHRGLLKSTLEAELGEGLVASGLQGETVSTLVGDMLALHNSFTLGLSEEDILSRVRSAVTKIVVAEKSAMAQLAEDVVMKDKVSRAFGLLLHSYQLETMEAMNALSLLKLGVGCQWLTGLSSSRLNDLFLHCRRAHLMSRFGASADTADLSHRRAAMIHETLKAAQLLL